jgi:glycerophosphoryl diester phosphodiesterase
MLIDVRLTSDGYFVASHDATINAEARNSDGTTISGDVTVADHTLAEINNYDFGIKYGSEYAGMNIPLIEDFIKFCGLRNCPFILEFKVIPSDAKIAEIGVMLRKYNVEKLAIIHGAESAAPKFSVACPYSPLGFSVSRITQSKIDTVMAYNLPNKNERWLYIGNWQNPVENTIDDLDEYLDTLVENNIKLGYTNTSDINVLNTLKQHGYLNVFKYLAFDDPVTFRSWMKNNW